MAIDLVAGLRLADYELVSPAGAGGFSEVWRAQREGQPFALKVPRVEAFVEHLRRQAALAAAVDDPRVVPVLEARLDHDPPFLVMPWVEGAPLELPDATPEPAAALVNLERVRALADVVALLHRQGLVHGDLKPGNVLFTPRGEVRLLDLGLGSIAVETSLERSLAQSVVSVDGRSIAGTLDYMAPELFDGRKPDARSDVYALGVLLHHALTGRPPAFGVSPASLNEDLPPGLDELLRRMLAQDPDRRPASARSILADLDRMLDAERRCLARSNGHARRRVWRARMATLRRGGRTLLVGAALPLITVAIVLAFRRVRLHGDGALLASGVAFVSVFAGAVAMLLGVTTINAWLLGVPERTYKDRPGHPLWTFMMQ